MTMSDELKRVAFLLAASDLTEKQLVTLVSELRRSSPETFLRFIRRLRTVNAAILETELPAHVKRRYSMVSKDEATARQVERLLREEADIPIKEAMKLLRGSLLEWDLPPSVLQVPARPTSEQFRSWLGKLLEHVPPSTLLHLATSLRNTRVHVETGDWPLKEGPSNAG
jgi:hypothetical protein